MNVCIIGSGNIGTYLAAYISKKPNNKVWLHTSKPEVFSGEIILIEEEMDSSKSIKIHSITSSYEEAVKDADYILITHPSFMFEATIDKIYPYLKVGAIVGTIPGFGGKEFYIDKLIKKNVIFFGSQRVPSIIRLEKYGESVRLKQKNEFMKIKVIPVQYSNKVAKEMTDFIDIPCIPMKNYLRITLSPSNPTMHPSRLYELFGDYVEGVNVYERNPYFYEEWGEIASTQLLKLDEELEAIFNAFNVNNDFSTEDIEKIKTRYNIELPSQLSEKINNAPGFLGIDSPMIKMENGYIPDKNSRYFIEDIKFGLCILKAFAEILEVKTPEIDKIVEWGQKFLDREYIVDGRLIGKDISELVIPQTMGITTKEDLIEYYKKL